MQPREIDEEAIRGVARAYLESWLDGDGERMRGALHPDLAKRGLDYAADRRPSGVHHLTAEYMERSAEKGPRPQFARTCEITVLDVADSIASAKVVSEPYVDYLHLTKLDGRWSIVNVLATLPPFDRAPPRSGWALMRFKRSLWAGTPSVCG